MKRTLLPLSAALLLGLGLLTACGPKRPALHIYTWADYISPEVVLRFEKETGCRVMIDTFDSNETMFAKIKAGASGYDLIMPSSYMAKLMKSEGLIRDLDHTLLPNARHVDPAHLAITVDKKMRYSVPYAITITGIAYLKSRVKDFEPTWACFDRAGETRRRMTMLNDMRETVGAALKFLGHSLNTRREEELAQARDVVIRWKQNLAKFENEQYKSGLASGEFLLVHGYSGDILQIQEDNDDIVFAVPREGTSISYDDMVIPVNARRPDLAHAFINFIHTPAIAAENTAFTSYLCPNAASYDLLSKEQRENPVLFPDAATLARCEIIEDLGEENVKYTKVWDAIKAVE